MPRACAGARARRQCAAISEKQRRGIASTKPVKDDSIMNIIGFRRSQGEMRLHKSVRFWRRGKKRRVVRAPKLTSKLVKLEREIGGVADHIAGTNRARTMG